MGIFIGFELVLSTVESAINEWHEQARLAATQRLLRQRGRSSVSQVKIADYDAFVGSLSDEQARHITDAQESVL